MLSLFLASLLPAMPLAVLPQDAAVECRATNARYNIVNQPKTGYDYIPIVEDDSLGFYVAYSAKQNDTNTDFVSTSCMYVLPLDGDEVLVFGGGFGDTWYVPGGAFFDADYDVAMIKDAIVGCMGRDPATTKIRFVAPHGHPDHITVAFIRALERAGFTLVEIAYDEGDRAWIEQLPWLPHHPALFHVLRAAPCGEEILAYPSPLGRIWFVRRPGHTPGSIDLVLDVLGNPLNRVLVMGSAPGGCAAPPGVTLTLAAHGTALVGGPRRAVSEILFGSGINRTALTNVTSPKLGTTWKTQIDTVAHPGASTVFLFGSDRRLNPTSVSIFGELFVDPAGRPLLSMTRSALSGVTTLEFDIPRDPTLMGRTYYVQGAIGGGGFELTNGLRVVIGF